MKTKDTQNIVSALGWAALLVAQSIAISGCGIPSHMESLDKNSERLAAQMEQDQAYIKSVNEQLKRMANSIEEFQKMAKDLTTLVKPADGTPATPNSVTPGPSAAATPAPTKLPSVDDLFGPDPAATPTPAPSTAPVPAPAPSSQPTQPPTSTSPEKKS